MFFKCSFVFVLESCVGREYQNYHFDTQSCPEVVSNVQQTPWTKTTWQSIAHWGAAPQNPLHLGRGDGSGLYTSAYILSIYAAYIWRIYTACVLGVYTAHKYVVQTQYIRCICTSCVRCNYAGYIRRIYLSENMCFENPSIWTFETTIRYGVSCISRISLSQDPNPRKKRGPKYFDFRVFASAPVHRPSR